MRNIPSPKHATVILFQLPFESLTITGKVDISILRNFLVVIKLSVHFDWRCHYTTTPEAESLLLYGMRYYLWKLHNNAKYYCKLNSLYVMIPYEDNYSNVR